MLEAGGPQYVRPDIGLGGGITHVKKIAALAESYHSALCTHNALGPITTSAAIQVDASIPNFVTQEYGLGDEHPANAVFIKPPQTPRRLHAPTRRPRHRNRNRRKPPRNSQNHLPTPKLAHAHPNRRLSSLRRLTNHAPFENRKGRERAKRRGLKGGGAPLLPR